MKQPWLKFHCADWRADPALRSCSLAARGLWIEMICIMHEAEPYGSLRIAGRPLVESSLAKNCGQPVRTVRAALEELEAAGVFDRVDGAIVSRRMMRDRDRAERDRSNGRAGGNPAVKGVNPRVRSLFPGGG